MTDQYCEKQFAVGSLRFSRMTGRLSRWDVVTFPPGPRRRKRRQSVLDHQFTPRESVASGHEEDYGRSGEPAE